MRIVFMGTPAIAATCLARLTEDGHEIAGVFTKPDTPKNRGMAVIANVGDSRAYLIGKDGIRFVTVDHSLVELMVQRGELTREQAKSHPGKNLITRAVGTEQSVECDIYQQKLGRGDQLLLCSDGLSNAMADQEILFEVLHGVHKEGCCQRLLDIAKSRGAPDNVTVVLVTV